MKYKKKKILRAGISDFFYKESKSLKKNFFWGGGSVNISEQMFQKGTSAQLCKIILKAMHKCRSYGSDKLNL